MKLYLVQISPGSRIVWLYCLQHNLDVDIVDVDIFGGEHKSEEFLKMNPTGEVPVLVDGDTVVHEPVVILTYLAEKYTSYAGFGDSTMERMKIISLLNWTSSTLHNILGYRVVYPHFVESYRLPNEDANEALIEMGTSEVTKELELLENSLLSRTSFLISETATVSDFYAATMIVQLEWINFEFHLWPHIQRWLDNLKKTPQWSKVHEKHNGFVQELHKHDS